MPHPREGDAGDRPGPRGTLRARRRCQHGCARGVHCSLAIELGPLGSSVNAVAPGPVQTGYVTPELEQQLLPWIPLGRVGTPNDIADVVVFLASAQARWITGQVIQVVGGHAL